MKQNKFRRKELPHLKEEIPFEPSNLNQKLEVSSILLVPSCVWKMDLRCCGRGGGCLSLVHTTARAVVVTHTTTPTSHWIYFHRAPSLQALSELKHHFDLYIFYTCQHFWSSKGKVQRNCRCWVMLKDIPGVCESEYLINLLMPV